jgi:hypothetical protein
LVRADGTVFGTSAMTTNSKNILTFTHVSDVATGGNFSPSTC